MNDFQISPHLEKITGPHLARLDGNQRLHNPLGHRKDADPKTLIVAGVIQNSVSEKKESSPGSYNSIDLCVN